MQSLAPVVRRLGIDICVVEPAAVGSDFVANAGADDAGPREPDALKPGSDPYAGMRAAYLRRSTAVFAAAQAPADAAAVVVQAATTAGPKFRWQTSPGATAFAGSSLRDLDGAGVLALTDPWLG